MMRWTEGFEPYSEMGSLNLASMKNVTAVSALILVSQRNGRLYSVIL
jgi:hypothetical protein